VGEGTHQRGEYGQQHCHRYTQPLLIVGSVGGDTPLVPPPRSEELLKQVLGIGVGNHLPRCPTWKPRKVRLTLVGADAHPCAFNYRALPAKVAVIQVRLASGGGWARLNLAVSAVYSIFTCASTVLKRYSRVQTARCIFADSDAQFQAKHQGGKKPQQPHHSSTTHRTFPRENGRPLPRRG